MAKAITTPALDVKVTIRLNEVEARALDALAGYGEDEFIKHFYDHLGSYYMEPHEKGLRTFLGSIRDAVRPALHKVDNARLLLEGKGC